jgi:hypothetical protein
VNLLELRAGLKDFGEYYTVSHEHHTAWLWEDQQDIAEHRARIAQEEARAAEICGTHTRPQALKRTNKTSYSGEERCYDGTHAESDYDPDLDPFLEDMSDQERQEYQQARQAVLPQSQKLSIYEQLGLQKSGKISA